MISVVLIDYYSAERTVRYIQDLLTCSDELINNIIIVDNSLDEENSQLLINTYDSSDISPVIEADVINKTYYGKYLKTNIYVIKTNENLGFARSNNLGARIATNLTKYARSEDNYLIFSNSDIVFPEKKFYLSKLLKVFQMNNQVALVGPDVRGLDYKIQSPCRYCNIFDRLWRGYFLWPISGVILGSVHETVKTDELKKVYRIAGCFMIADLKKFNDVDGFDETTFMYGEEPILSERYKRNGFEVWFLPDVTIFHEGGYTVLNGDKNLARIKQVRMMFDSLCYYYLEYRRTNVLIVSFTKIIVNSYVLKRWIASLVVKGVNTLWRRIHGIKIKNK